MRNGQEEGHSEHIERVVCECVQRAQSWSVPSKWTFYDWIEEMRAEARAAAYEAVSDYDPINGISFEQFLRGHVLACLLTHYRREWLYCARYVSMSLTIESVCPEGETDCLEQIALESAIRQLKTEDADLVRQLFWQQKTETEIAREKGISQPAIAQRKKRSLRDLHQHFCEHF